MFLFFFSSRRRHTRWPRDWSSDVCSSDLGDDGFPRLQVIQGSEATGILDPVTRLLTEGYAVLSRDEYGDPYEELYFVTGRTDYYVKGKLADSVNNDAPAPLLVPIIHRPDSTKPFRR